MRRNGRDDHGFILITALWLLLLCGTIVSLMMLRSSQKAEATHRTAAMLQSQLDLAAAVDTIAADMLFNGERSRWVRSPASGSIDLDGRKIDVEVSSEAGLLDLNDGDLAVIDRALQGLGIAGTPRAVFIGKLQQLRLRHRRIDSDAELAALLGGLSSSPDLCLDRYVTLYSGLGRPDEKAMPAGLAQALAVPRGNDEGGTILRPGAPIRLRLRDPQGLSLVAVVRIVGTLERSHDVLRWTSAPTC